MREIVNLGDFDGDDERRGGGGALVGPPVAKSSSSLLYGTHIPNRRTEKT